MRTAVIGATIVDVVTYVEAAPEYGEEVRAADFHIACSGKGANQAIAAKRLGADILMVSAVGDDLFGATALENYRRNGIDTRWIVTVPKVANGAVMIIVEKTGQYRSMYYHEASDFLTPEKLMAAAEDLKTCGLFVIQLEIPLETVYAAVEFANENNIPVVLNPSPLEEKIALEKVCTCEFFVLNETELKILTGLPVDSREEIRAAAGKLLACGLKNIILTLGSRGSIWFAAGVEEFVPTLEVEAVDSTGAGDAFTGCFVKSYAQGKKIRDAIELASKYAALSVTRKGTQDSYLTAAEFENFLIGGKIVV